MTPWPPVVAATAIPGSAWRKITFRRSDESLARRTQPAANSALMPVRREDTVASSRWYTCRGCDGSWNVQIGVVADPRDVGGPAVLSAVFEGAKRDVWAAYDDCNAKATTGQLNGADHMPLWSNR